MFITGHMIVTALLACLAAYALVQLGLRADTRIENRRKSASQLACLLKEHGLIRIPDFLINYSVGDYSGMAASIAELAKQANGDPTAVIGELKTVYKRILEAELKTEEGIAYVAAAVDKAKAAVKK